MARPSNFKASLIHVLFIMAITFQVHASEEAGGNEKALKMGQQYARQIVITHKEKIISLTKSNEVISFLKANNDCQPTLASIIEKDKEWPLSSVLQKTVTENRIAVMFQSIIENKNFSIAEIMLVGGYGELIAAYPTPSDYWQGDEAKFYEPLKRQDVYVSDANWDFSTQSHTFFISLPIVEQNQIIGVLIAGLDVSLEYMMQLRLEDLIEVKFNGHKKED